MSEALFSKLIRTLERQNSLLADINKSLEKIASKEQSFENAKKKVGQSVF